MAPFGYIFIVCFICCFHGHTGQQIEISYTNCQFVFRDGEKLDLEVFVNTTKADIKEWPLDNIMLFDDFQSVNCTVNITRDGCNKPDASRCGYCDRQKENGFVLYFSTLFRSLDRYVILWQGTANHVQNALFSGRTKFEDAEGVSWSSSWQVYFNITFSTTSGVLSFNSVISHWIFDNTDAWEANTLSLGTNSTPFQYAGSHQYYQPTASINEDIRIVTNKPNCEFVCQPLGILGFHNTEVKVQETSSTRFNVTLLNIYTNDIAVAGIYFDGIQGTDVIRNTALMFTINNVYNTTLLTHTIDIWLNLRMSRCSGTMVGTSSTTTPEVSTTFKPNGKLH